jgi:iron complex outermembrane receptor protein
MGGVINVITKAPVNKTRFFGEVSFGNFGTQQYNAGFSTGVIPGKLFVGFAFQYQGRDGYYRNLFTDSDFDAQSMFSGNYYIIYKPAPKWKISLNVKHLNHRNKGAFPLAPDKASAFAEPFILNQNATATMQDDGLNASLSLQYLGEKVEFHSQTAYQQNNRIYDRPLDGDFSPLDIVSIFNDYGNAFNRVSVWTQEIRFNSRPSEEKKLHWTAGTFLFSQDNPVKQATIFGKNAPLLGFPDSNFALIGTNLGKSKGLAFFGQIRYQILPKLALTAGLRYDYEQRELSIQGEFQQDPNPPFITRPDTSASNGFHAVSPKLGLSYQLAEKSLVYLQYSRGFRAGGYTALSTDPSQPPLFAYDPEFSDNIELGWKFQGWKNRLRFNAALFYTRVQDAQVPTLVLPDAFTVIRNAGSLNSQGFEWELTVLPLKGLEIQYNAGWLRSSYQTLRLSQNGQEVNYDGNKQVFSPASTSLVMAQYGLPIGVGKQWYLTVRGEWIRNGKQYFDLANKISQDAYNLFNLRGGVQFKNYGMHVWIRNLTDETYIAYAYDFGGVHLGNPKTYGVTVSARF